MEYRVGMENYRLEWETYRKTMGKPWENIEVYPGKIHHFDWENSRTFDWAMFKFAMAM